MSRVEEWKERKEKINMCFEEMSEEMAFKLSQLAALMDAAESLAVIADVLQEMNMRQALKTI